MGYIGAGISRFNTADELTVTGDAEFNGNINLGDNDKATFGAGSDLQIYHSGTENVIDSNTGTLVLRSAGAGTIELRDQGSQVLAQFNDNSDVKLYHNNSPKLATTASGIDVTGTLVADGLTVDNNGTIEMVGGSSKLLFKREDSTTIAGNPLGAIEFSHTDTNDAGTAAKIIGEGDGGSGEGRIAFYTGTPSALSERLRITAAGAVGIGTASPARTFSVESTSQLPVRIKSTNTINFIEMGDSTGSIRFGSRNSGSMSFYTGGDASFGSEAETVRILAAGGITFNGDTAAANALDDYEEGTWTLTPADSSGNNSSTTIVGNYTKIGNIVHVQCSTISNMITSNMVQNTSEVLRMTGLPFAASNSNFVGSVNMNNLTFDTGRSQISATTVSSQSYFRIMKQGSGVNTAFATPSDCISGNTDFINLTMTYTTNS